MPLLHPGDTSPAFDADLVGGDSPSLPDALAGGFGVVLYNRGEATAAEMVGKHRLIADRQRVHRLTGDSGVHAAAR